MENKQSGTASPPIVSPRPIQTQQQPLTADESWKIVGSPPRRPLLSPPEDKERNRVLQETDITTVEGNRTRAIGADLVDLADSTISSLSAGTCNESSSSSSASSISSPTSPTPPQHKLLSHPVLAGQDMGSGLAPLIPPVASGARALSPLDRDSLPDQSATHPMHFKSSSTGTPTSQRTDTTSFSILGQQDLKPVESFHAKSQSLNIGSRGALKQSGTGLESPLSLGSFIWTGTASKDASDLSVTNPKSTHGDIISTGIPRTARSLSFSDSGFANTFRLPTTKLGLDLDEDDLLRYRPPLPTMEEEAEDALEPRINRARSFSTSATFGSDAFTGGLSMFSSPDSQDSFTASARSLRGSESALGGDNRLLLHRESPGGSATWPGPVGPDTSLSNHRRSVTSTSAYSAPIWDSFQPLPSPLERQRVARRFSLAPASGFQNYDAFLDDVDAGNSSTMGSLSR
ncbi:hypothetical protein BC939DRAFT_212053 [Gamsiella multidivaricata]|uniref:uncharacterized protein n=1 Tax=Gamsiella multidivaricata TaxID=101098 RepID=UPI002220B782|nr:uncharacterized protein BC939DRAFT_212053 [Gamsiella multidivaricata]KAI7821067.1 hypothetical protein BC939DRAFT_212053 [Gamsiella multidivaricata]